MYRGLLQKNCVHRTEKNDLIVIKIDFEMQSEVFSTRTNVIKGSWTDGRNFEMNLLRPNNKSVLDLLKSRTKHDDRCIAFTKMSHKILSRFYLFIFLMLSSFPVPGITTYKSIFMFIFVRHETSRHTNVGGVPLRVFEDEPKTNRTSKPKSALGFRKVDRLGRKTRSRRFS